MWKSQLLKICRTRRTWWWWWALDDDVIPFSMWMLSWLTCKRKMSPFVPLTEQARRRSFLVWILLLLRDSIHYNVHVVVWTRSRTNLLGHSKEKVSRKICSDFIHFLHQSVYKTRLMCDLASNHPFVHTQLCTTNKRVKLCSWIVRQRW